MGAYIDTLLDKNGQKFYPKTKTSAVYDNDNNTLDSVITNIENVIEVVDGNGAVKTAINPTSEEIAGFEEGAAWVETPPIKPYLEFSSDGNFTLSVTSPQWFGTIEYSLDEGNTWITWNGRILSGTASQPIYLRGTGNNIGISKGYKWRFTGKYVIGNIETLLDYQTVVNGQHPTMGNGCYNKMFQDCSSLVTPPELPATTLASSCYGGMFQGCTSLTTAPKLPATTLADMCYVDMFNGCTSLVIPPELPATILIDMCYINMFYGCTSLKLSATQTGDYQYPYRIPTSGTGTDAAHALMDMFSSTGGTFKGTPTINTTYYTEHEPIPSDISVDPNELCIKINNSEKRINLDENVADKLDKYASGSSDWDAAPTQNSTKAVTSGGVYQAIDDVIKDLVIPSTNAIRTDLGNPSSASAVTGADAFSKISKLNSDLTNVPNLIGTVTAQSGETYAQVLNRVGTMIANAGRSLRGNCVMLDDNSGYASCYIRTSYGPSYNVFSLFILGASTVNMYSATVGTTGSQLKAIVNGSATDLTNSAATVGETFTVYG